jgi:RNA polymerase primary sigma factor
MRRPTSTGLTVENLADGDINVQEITMDAHGEAVPSMSRAEDLVGDEEAFRALRQARKQAELTTLGDSVRAYLQQIGKVALLTAEQEVQLAQRIEAGLYAAERLRRAQDTTETLAPQLRRDLCWIVRDGQRAQTHLLEANLRLVVSVAKRYTGRGMPLLDRSHPRAHPKIEFKAMTKLRHCARSQALHDYLD